MLMCEEDDESPGRSFYVESRRHSCSLPFPPFGDSLSRLSLYQKLPPLLFNISVLKLDGSSFNVQIEGTATVAELKQAVEDVFIHSPKEGEGKISWSHVWGHFCLCYEGLKLINDKAYIRNFGINDGDELHFIRNLSMDYNLMKRQSKKGRTSFTPHRMSLTGSHVLYEEKEEDASDLAYVYGDGQEEMDARYNYYDEEYKQVLGEDITGHSQFKLAPFLRGWFSHPKLWHAGKKRSEGKISRKFSVQSLKMGPKMTSTRV
ncbi:hypothetical protein GIB67_015003 [Kingdonia uniflora]|uniref:SNRNP25 ubiquitin-like domain-containing protein n=1 Tax=Kingdonia uniflora TaxID=39325 RepID=A0A7J7MTF4_9MAGN|nr:hypothetical protein GIB67_015003 [Kingdonia uniflora]